MGSNALAVKIRRIYLIAISAGLAVTLLCYLVIHDAYRRQQIRDWHQKLETISDSQAPFLLQELVNDRFYAAAIRGREIHEENRDNGLEIGLYRTDGTPIYESDHVTRIHRTLGKLVDNKDGIFEDTIYCTKELKFAGETIGFVLLAAQPSFAGHKELRTALWLTLVVLLVVFLSIFICLELSLKRLVLRPTRQLVESIPLLGDYLNGEVAQLNLPSNLGSAELSKVAETLKDMGMRLREVLNREKDIEIRAERSLATAEISRQVAHDIRSPLTALSVAATSFSLPEDQRILLRSAVARISDIANNLASQNAPAPSAAQTENSCQLVSVLVESLISEKRIQVRDNPNVTIIQSSVQSYGLFAYLDPAEFKRVLSNLIDNAIDASGTKGTVFVRLDGTPESINVAIRDEGCGIPTSILPTLMQKGATFGKPNGSGLGLYHAKKCVESWLGHIDISSMEGEGTCVKLTFPRAKAPNWFVDKIEVTLNDHIVILDDDESIHQVWKSRLAELDLDISHFRSGSSLKNWLESMPGNLRSTTFLIDYELRGQSETGLDLIEKFQIGSRAFLVTSHFEEDALRARCHGLGVRLIPKAMAGNVPIEARPPQVSQIGHPTSRARGSIPR